MVLSHVAFMKQVEEPAMRNACLLNPARRTNKYRTYTLISLRGDLAYYGDGAVSIGEKKQTSRPLTSVSTMHKQIVQHPPVKSQKPSTMMNRLKYLLPFRAAFIIATLYEG